MRGIILDLCAGTGAWSQPYKDAGYVVKRIEIQAGEDVILWPGRNKDIRDYTGMVHGILASPPCTVFSTAGARWPRTDDDIRAGLAVVDACIRIVHAVRPKWWALENPIGRIVRWLGNPAFTFQPTEYGDPYMKRTQLWGDFQVPQKSPVFAVDGSKMSGIVRKQAERSVTPAGFAKAFMEANP